MNKPVFDTLEALLKQEVFYYFGEISKIPRPSGGEKEISNYLLSFGRSLGFEAVQDEFLNVIIKKPGTPGYENSPAVLLQAHMDMVCEKTPASNHDFSKDPILLELDGDMLKSKGEETTLGVDNGMGVAYIMAVLASKDIPHPPIEALITADEEDGFSGVEGVSPDHFTALNLINLDHSVCDEVLTGSCGGGAAEIRLPLEFEPVPENYKAYNISIADMAGGHSGEDIHRGRGSAIALMARILIALRPTGVRLSTIFGGTVRNAIPRDSGATVFATDEQYLSLKEIVAMKATEFHLEYKVSAPNMKISVILDKAPGKSPKWMAEDSFTKVLQAISLMPNGIAQMNGAIEGIVESSCNLGIVQVEEETLVLTVELRGGYVSTCDAICEKISLLGEALRGKVEFFAPYAPWEYRPDSNLRDLATSVYKKETGKALRTLVVHAGIECGELSSKIPGIDAISIGPDSWYFHSVHEKVSVSAVIETWGFLKALLEAMK